MLAAAAGKPFEEIIKIALFTPRAVIPAAIVDSLEQLFGKENVVDAQELYYKIKNIKSDAEMELIADACIIATAAMRAMLAVIKAWHVRNSSSCMGLFC